MSRHIAILQGHPSGTGDHFCHALAEAYARGAVEAGHEVRRIDIAKLDFALLRSKADWDDGMPPPDIQNCQTTIAWADHLVIIYPLWLGDMPALLKGFLEQVMRPGFATSKVVGGMKWKTLLNGRTARIVVTMGMPSLVYRWYFGAHSLKSLKRNILRFVGIRPVGDSLIGMVEGSEHGRQKWLGRMHTLGRSAR